MFYKGIGHNPGPDSVRWRISGSPASFFMKTCFRFGASFLRLVTARFREGPRGAAAAARGRGGEVAEGVAAVQAAARAGQDRPAAGPAADPALRAAGRRQVKRFFDWRH